MNEIVNTFLLAGDKFMPDMHFKQPGFTYGVCGPFTNNKEKIQKIKETRNTQYICRNELDKTCFQHDMVYGDFKYLARRTASDKDLRDKLAFDIAKNPNMMDIKENLHLRHTNFWIKCPKLAVLLCLQIMDN